MGASGILFLHETARISGAENSLLNLVQGLDRARFTPYFILGEEGALADELRSRGIGVYIREFPRVRCVAGVARACAFVRGIIREKDIRVVHSNSIRTHLYAAMAARGRAKVVWHQRNLLTNELVDPDRLFAFLPDRIVCNSAAIAARFASGGRIPAKVIVVMNGVDTAAFNPEAGPGLRRELGIAADEFVVGMASRFNAEKGHEIFLDAARLLVEREPRRKWRFLVAGGAVFSKDAEREGALKEAARRKGLEDKVTFCGFRTDMPRVYGAMDIFVLAARAEPCGRVVLEAMASGKPVVATSGGGTPEMITDGETGFLVPPGDAAAIAEKVLFLAGHTGEAAALGGAARACAVARFDIRINVAKIQALYGELEGGHGG